MSTMRSGGRIYWGSATVGVVASGLVGGLLIGHWPITTVAVFGLFIGWSLRFRMIGLASGLLFFGAIICGVLRAGQLSTSLTAVSSQFGTKQTIHGVVTDDPTYADRGQTEFYVANARIDNGAVLPGRVRVRGFVLTVARGDQVTINGKLLSGFGSYTAAMYFAEIQVTGHDNGWANTLRHRFQAGLYSALPDNQASLAFGLLVGARSSLPAALNEQLAIVGLMHLVAVSGYNLTIIVRASRRLGVGMSPKISLGLALFMISGFLLVTGFSASIVRAAIVSLLSLMAWFYGREPKPLLLLAMSAAITAMINPLYLWGDLGWYLSFLAFFGILLFAPSLRRPAAPKRVWAQVLTETMSAIILTAPLIMFSFGRVSLIAPIANLLILPFVPFAMFLAFVAGIAGMIRPEISWIFAGPARVLLGTMIKCIGQLGSVSWAQRSVSISAWEMAVCYGLIFCFYVMLHSKRPKNRAIITDINNQEL